MEVSYTAKINKIGILRPEIKVEYIKPIIGRLYAFCAWLRCIRLLKMHIGYLGSGGSVGVKCYRLIIPKFRIKKA
jgi:hypothetical protein